MKRFFRDVCNMESTMRKKAALDLKATLKRQEEEKRLAAQRIMFDSHGEPHYTLQSLPSYMFHLGEDNFISIVFYLDRTYVHIRRFVTDDDGFLHPTKDGVSLSPIIWHSFQQKIKRFKFDDQFLVIEKDLCVSYEKKEEKSLFVFQRMFQRQNLSFQFKSESIILTGQQLQKLMDSIPEISVQVKNHLIKETLLHFVLEENSHCHVIKELETSAQVYKDYHDFTELTDSLCKCLTASLSSKISEIFKCFACEECYPLSDLHDCIQTSRAEKYEGYFEQALYCMDWGQLGKDFYEKNENNFGNDINDFFCCLDVSILLKNVEKLYIDDEKNLTETLMFSIE